MLRLNIFFQLNTELFKATPKQYEKAAEITLSIIIEENPMKTSSNI